MTLQEEFLKILDKKQMEDLLPFLQNLTSQEKKDFVKPFKKIAKEYLEDYGIIDYTYKRKGTVEQGQMIALAGFTLLNRQDFERKGYGDWLIGEKCLMQVLNWFVPGWFSEFINGYARAEFISFKLTYEWLMDLKKAALADPSPELIAKVLPDVIFEPGKNHIWHYKPQNLKNYKITLEEHIWYLFQYETDIHYCDRFIQVKSLEEGQGITWIDAFINLANKGEIERMRLLKESISATTRGFNKVLTGWFAELFIKLEPNTAEILLLQDYLFNALNSQQSKPVNTILNFFKKLADEPEFKVEEFLDYTALLFSSETKSVVTATLIILEKIAKKYPDKRQQVLLALCPSFIQADEAIQVRAAKLIQKYGIPDSEMLTEALIPYQANLLSNARALLQNFLAQSPAEEIDLNMAPDHVTPQLVLTEDNAIPAIQSFDELVFLACQAFDNNRSYHLDLLPAALLQFKEEIRGENITKLAPAFQRAYSMIVADFTSTMGYLDHLLATFFMNYAIYLINTYPEESSEILKIHNAFMKKDQDLHAQSSWRGLRLAQLSGWSVQDHDKLYLPYKQKMLLTLDKLKVKNKVPLLSTPTHLPGWISPFVLIDRLQEYQASGDIPEDIDFQIALARVKLENQQEALAYAGEQLTGEYKRLMQFLLQPDVRPNGPYAHESWWVVAALTKNPATYYEEFNHFSYNKWPRSKFTGQFPWKSFEEHYTIDHYDYVTQKTSKVPATRKVFRVDLETLALQQTKLKTFISKFIPGKKEGEPLVYEYLILKNRYFTAEYNDIERLLLMIPNNPEPLLGHISRKSLEHSTFSEEGDKRVVTKALETLLQIWLKFGTMAHVFVATCMLSSDKTIRAFAAEIWVKGVSEGTIQNELLGEIIGIHESIEFAPLKRFTDLIISNMYQLSGLHNKALQDLLANMLLQLPEKPIKNLKLLLQIYVEILSLNNASIKDFTLINKVANWQETASLNKVAKSLAGRTQLV